MNIVKILQTDVQDDVREEALERMMSAYGTSMLRMAFLYLRDVSLAEDAVQEAFLKAYLHGNQYRGQSSEKSWLTRIVINTCKDVRRCAWMRFVDRRVAIDQMPDAGKDFPAADDTVLREILHLSNRDKEVILLRYYQGMKIQEIGEALQVPESTVSSRLSHAKQKLHQRLERWYFDEE
ncbi:MAG: sigma-70 family RNA polymerase sigma factor [Clostridia bacterium]